MNLIFIQDCRKIAYMQYMCLISTAHALREKEGRENFRSDKIWGCKFSKKSLEFSRLGRSRALDLSLGASRLAMKGHECDVATDKDNLEMTMKIGENLLVLYDPKKMQKSIGEFKRKCCNLDTRVKTWHEVENLSYKMCSPSRSPKHKFPQIHRQISFEIKADFKTLKTSWS